MRIRVLSSIVMMTASAAAGVVAAQGRGGVPWTTLGNDAQRASWVRSDPKITPAAIEKGAFQFLWSTQLDNTPRQRESLTQPVLLPNIISYKGFKALAFIGGSADVVFAIDYDLNRLFWTRHLETGADGPGTAECPGALTAITKLTQLAPAAPPASRGSFLGPGGAANAPGAGRSSAPGDVSPGAGAPANLPPAAGAPAPGGQPAGRATPPARSPVRSPNANQNPNNNVYVVSSGGMLHALNPQTGEDVEPPRRFVTAGAKLAGLILVENTVYAAATAGCGGTRAGVYAIDISGRDATPRAWDAGSATIAGTAGVALGPSGTVYVATAGGQGAGSNAIVALDSRTLNERGRFTAATPFVSSPVVFLSNGRELVASANSDGRVYLVDGAALAGGVQNTPPVMTARLSTPTGFAPGALSTWEGPDRTRWIVASGGSGVAAFKVTTDQNGTPSFESGWSSRQLATPLPAAIVNGVVFALSGGESESKPAVLYALDGATGRELWTSGATIKSVAHAYGPSAGDSQVYVVTYDGTVYAFGIPLEH